MKKLWNTLAKDLWIVLLDIVAVNLSYYLALIIRFFVNGEFRSSVSYLIEYWGRFAPIYTIFAIIIFMLFRLYGGMWRYAGINDMNRIIGANACTIIIMVLGTILINPKRMPFTYYILGAILQFVFIVIIRFSYRLLLVEKTKLKKVEKIPAAVVGFGDLGRKVIHHLEENTPYRATMILSNTAAGRSMDGIPVIGLDEMKQTVNKVKAVFIADKNLSQMDRQCIADAAKDLEIQDFTGALSNMTGAVPVTGLLEVIDGPITLVIDGNRKEYKTSTEALAELKTKYLVTKISGGQIEIDLKTDDGLAYLRQHAEDNGEELSFF